MNFVLTRKWAIVGAGSVSTIALIGALGYFVMRPSIDADGTILMSARTTAGNALVYNFNLATMQAEPFRTGADYYAPQIAPSGKVSVVTTDENGVFGLFIADDITGSNAQKIVPPDPTSMPGVSAWSADERYLAYSVLNAGVDRSDATTEETRMVILDTTTGDQQVIDEGVSPVFTNDGSLLYLSSNGMHRARLGTNSWEVEENVIAFPDGDGVTRFSMIAATGDGSRVVIAQPHLDMVFVYERNGDGTYTQQTGLFATASWPVISPDGEKVAYIALSPEGTRTLEMYEFASEARETMADFSAYVPEFLSLTGWRS